MATLINDVDEFNNLVLELKQKITNSLEPNIENINTTLGSIENYKNNGFSANVLDIANSIKSNLQNILTDITNSEQNLFDYADCINKVNVDDYNTKEQPVNLDNLYNELYVKKTSTKKKSSNGNDNKHNNSETTNPENKQDTKLEDYLDTIQGKIIPTKPNLELTTNSVNLDNDSLNPETLTMFSEVTYNEEGFAIFHERYVISTSSNYGMVGDLLNIKQADGTTLKCIIGNVDITATDDVLNFCIDQSIFNGDINLLHPNWLKSIIEVNNKGNYFDYLKHM